MENLVVTGRPWLLYVLAKEGKYGCVSVKTLVVMGILAKAARRTLKVIIVV